RIFMRFLFLIFCFFATCVVTGVENVPFLPGAFISSPDVENEAQAAFEYFLREVELDAALTHEEQQEKIQEFNRLIESLSPDAASLVTTLLLQETRSRIMAILENAALDKIEIEAYLADYANAILRVQNMTVQIARQMLFFVA